MKIAVIGAGFSGLAVTWHLLNYNSSLSISIYDEKEIGEGTSGVAAGLMHPFVGASAKLNRFGHEGFLASKRLLEISSKAIQEPVARYDGILRLAVTEKQQNEYFLSAKTNPNEIEWFDKETCQKLYPQVEPYSGIFIKKAASVNCLNYLRGLLTACQNKGALFYQRKIQSISEFDDYDLVVVATGAYLNELFADKKWPINQVKGQILKLTWPEKQPPIPLPISSEIYMLMDEDLKNCIIGATYERGFSTLLPDESVAKIELYPKACKIIPFLKSSTIVNCKAGVRATTPDRMPLIANYDERTWILSGMGSRGLLYHAYFAEQLVRNIL